MQCHLHSDLCHTFLSIQFVKVTLDQTGSFLKKDHVIWPVLFSWLWSCDPYIISLKMTPALFTGKWQYIVMIYFLWTTYIGTEVWFWLQIFYSEVVWVGLNYFTFLFWKYQTWEVKKNRDEVKFWVKSTGKRTFFSFIKRTTFRGCKVFFKGNFTILEKNTGW